MSLFEAPRTAKRRTSRELVPFGAACPSCGGSLSEVTVDMPALFFHGGYGGTRRSTWALCEATECRWSLERAVTEVRPEVRPARLVAR